MKLKTFIILSLAATIGFTAEAIVKMPNIFSDNMMFQREAPVKIWGTAEPNAQINVAFADNTVKTKADKNGKWSLSLPAMKASAQPREMTVAENDTLAVRIKNILVGEVWIASGQSNMEWSVGSTTDADLVKKTAKYPQMRYFKQRGDFASVKPLDDCVNGRWIETTPNAAMGYSAVGFYFAEQIMKNTDVPVAIIYAALGATPMHAWVPADLLDKTEAFKTDVKNHAQRMKDYNYAALHAKWLRERNEYTQKRKDAIRNRMPKLPQPSGFVQNEPIPEDPQGPRQLPSGSFNAKIAPIVGYTVRGVIWYQGESDAHTFRVADFEQDFTLLIDKWRELWQNKSMPFYFVQLTAHYRPHDWPAARDAQRKVSEKLENAKMAVTVDVGSEKEIHPKNKKPIGIRLANIALKEIYKKDVVYPYSPKFSKFAPKGASATINFETGGRKLECRGAARGFEILAPDGKWLTAAAAFTGKSVILKSPNGESINGARYLWKSWCGDDVCIFNEDGLPLAPFSTQK